jgi:hypothetical protein
MVKGNKRSRASQEVERWSRVQPPQVWRENDVPVIAPQTAAQVPQTPAVSSSPCSALSLCRPLSLTLLLSHSLFFFHLQAYLPCFEVDRCLAGCPWCIRVLGASGSVVLTKLASGSPLDCPWIRHPIEYLSLLAGRAIISLECVMQSHISCTCTSRIPRAVRAPPQNLLLVHQRPYMRTNLDNISEV